MFHVKHFLCLTRQERVYLWKKTERRWKKQKNSQKKYCIYRKNLTKSA